MKSSKEGGFIQVIVIIIVAIVAIGIVRGCIRSCSSSDTSTSYKYEHTAAPVPSVAPEHENASEQADSTHPSSKTDLALSFGDTLKSSIDAFENDRQKTSTSIAEAAEITNKELQKEKVDLRSVAKRWESDWDGVATKVKKLERDCNKVGRDAQNYFDELDKLASNMSDDNNKRAEAEKNKNLKTQWESAYQKAKEDIENLKNIKIKGDDFHNRLLMEELRGRLEQSIDVLHDISTQAASILSQLQNLTREGNNLLPAKLSGNKADNTIDVAR